jgi:glyoxylase-like metal-dependent hydrolase (beta-lactamase superfamily II)
MIGRSGVLMKTIRILFGLVGLLLFGSTVMAQAPAAGRPTPAMTVDYSQYCPQQPACNIRSGTVPSVWYTGGPKCTALQEWEAHEYNPDMYVLRQSGCTDDQQPFIFLMFGTERALLIDTGSRAGNIVPQMQLIIHRWLKRNGRASIPLLIVHSHAHIDHIFGDGALQAMNDPAIPVTLVAATVEANKKFFNITNWPEQLGKVDLGDRIVDAIPAPGHEVNAVVYYDRQTAILFTGDNVYPGRLFIRDFDAYKKSNERLIQFTSDKPVTHVWGNHIGKTRTPYIAYPTGAIYQPDPHEIVLSRGVLLEIEEGLESMHGRPRLISYRDFTLAPNDNPIVQKEMRGTSEATKAYQIEHMWDQYAR